MSPRFSCLRFVCAICVICGCDLFSSAATMADIDQAVAAIADYDAGKPRPPLFQVEELVRKTSGQAELRRHLERKLVGLLTSGASSDCKLFVCQQLWVVGSDAGAATLGAMLLDEKTAHMACYALGQSTSLKAGAALRSALGKAKGKALVQIIIQLGQRRDRQSVAALVTLLQSRDAEAANTAAVALGRIGTAEAAKALNAARGEARLHDVATRAYLRCAQRLAADGQSEVALAIYGELHKGNEPHHVRRGALLGLMRVGGEKVVPFVVSVLRGEDAQMKAVAVAGIRTMQAKGAAERFAAELPKLEPKVQVLLIGALAGRPDPAIRPAFIAAARSSNAQVRTAAIQALGKTGDAACVLILAQAIGGGATEGEARAAANGLRSLRGQGVDSAIIQAMKAAKPRVRGTLIEVLHDRNAVAAVPALLEQAAGSDKDVRKAAFRALARLAGPKDVPALTQLLVGLGGGSRDGEKAVVLAARKIGGEAARADAVVAALGAAKSDAAKASLIRVLGGIANGKALGSVQAALTDGSAQVQDAAVRELANWPDARAAAALLGVVQTTKSNVHRVIALRGYVRLLGLAGSIPSAATLKSYEAVLRQARSAQEKKLVLGALAGVTHPAALALVEPLLKDAEVKAEAELAALRIARSVAGAAPEAARPVLSQLAKSAADAATRKEAATTAGALGKLVDYIAAWQVAGPYVQEGRDGLALFRVAFPPETPDGRADWRLLPLGPPTQPWMLDLAGALGAGEHRAGYARTWIHSSEAQAARLEFGTDDGNRVWLNGKVVFAKNVGGAAVPGGYKANVQLREGWNALLLKVTQLSGPWQFCLAVRRRDGGKLAGLRIDAFGPPPQ